MEAMMSERPNRRAIAASNCRPTLQHSDAEARPIEASACARRQRGAARPTLADVDRRPLVAPWPRAPIDTVDAAGTPGAAVARRCSTPPIS